LDGYSGGVVTYGERLRELRAERRLSLRQVEERGGPNKDTMSLIERDVHRPHPQTLGRIAKALDMSVSELRFELEPAVPLAEAPPDTGQPGTERTARDIAHAEALRQEARDRKAARRTLASEGIDPARRISDVHNPAVYDVLRRQPSDELAGALLDAEQDFVRAEQEYANLREALTRGRELLRERDERIARLEEENAHLREEREREAAR